MKAEELKPECFPLGREEAGAVLDRIIPAVREAVRGRPDPSVTAIAKRSRSPFRVLVSTIISARTKDEVTEGASRRLFALADNPTDLAALDLKEIEKAIYPAGFYRNKAKAISRMAGQLLTDFSGEVPDRIEQLVTLAGVGRKNANLVVTLAFEKPGICVDTHVHKICNRLGVVATAHPDQTELALRAVLAPRHWIPINDLLVLYGQSVCTPVSPRCSICVISAHCRRVGVTTTR